MNSIRLAHVAAALTVLGPIAAPLATAQTPAASSASAAAATADNKAGGSRASLSSQDKQFVDKAGEAGAAEVAMGKLASARAPSSDVKAFASRMVSDHEQAGNQLKSIADGKGTSVPATLSTKDQATLDYLSKLYGRAFETVYIRAQLAAHKDAVALFASESQTGKDAQLKEFAAATLPTLKGHLRMAQQVAKGPKS